MKTWVRVAKYNSFWKKSLGAKSHNKAQGIAPHCTTNSLKLWLIQYRNQATWNMPTFSWKSKPVAEHFHQCIYLDLSSKNTSLIILITGMSTIHCTETSVVKNLGFFFFSSEQSEEKSEVLCLGLQVYREIKIKGIKRVWKLKWPI